MGEYNRHVGFGTIWRIFRDLAIFRVDATASQIATGMPGEISNVSGNLFVAGSLVAVVPVPSWPWFAQVWVAGDRPLGAVR
jgi:hypothetical protein